MKHSRIVVCAVLYVGIIIASVSMISTPGCKGDATYVTSDGTPATTQQSQLGGMNDGAAVAYNTLAVGLRSGLISPDDYKSKIKPLKTALNDALDSWSADDKAGNVSAIQSDANAAQKAWADLQPFILKAKGK